MKRTEIRRELAIRSLALGVALTTLAMLPMLPMLGCGGNRRTPSVASPGTDGFLRSVEIRPTPGSAFIPRGTRFLLSWSPETPPPATFSVALRRYKEARGEEERSIETQATELVRQGESFVWELKRRDDFDLDSGGVYYLELIGGGESLLATYLVANDRSVSPTSGSTGRAAIPSSSDGKAVSIGEVHQISRSADQR